ncbi:MAG: HAMP domain-containing sensor histidine kinase [Bacteroidota bacterium]|nr:HAMP domain-containing sensor histidine kinase [Bacteroidota bacterium]
MNISNIQKELTWLTITTLLVFTVSLVYFSNMTIKEIKEREIKTIERYSKFIELVANSEVESANYFVDDILIENNSIPIIVTDSDGNIIEYKNISEPSESNLFDQLGSMKKRYEPIKINILDKERNEVGYQLIYYNNSKILDLLIIAPYFIISLTFLILLSIYLISFYSNKSERDRLWTGLAKETAHQLGTPLSSLIGWNEYLKSKKKVDKGFISSEIDKDLNRLKIITDRFSTIGSKPSLIDTDIKKTIIESIDYLKRRVSPNVKTKLNLETVNYNFNKQLFGWVIENLYKNSIDAIGKNGNVEIKLYEDKDSVIIDFIDDGIGINKSDFSKIFKPGFTTKERGWGLGLTLVNRIISDYHKGRIYVKNSIKNVETTIRIELKKFDKKS